MRFTLLAACAAIFAFSLPAAAQDYKTILDIPPGQTLLSLSATGRTQIQQDLLVATLRFEAQNDDPKALQDRINEVMTKALAEAKDYEDIKVSTRQYYVYPHDYDPDPPRPRDDDQQRERKRSWRGSQSMEIRSRQADELLELAGTLQEMGLTMSGLNYTVSPELLEQTRESLLEAALAKLTAKAKRAAAALGKSEAGLLEVDVSMDGGHYPQPVMRAMAMGAERAQMNAPVAAPGESEVTLTVSARAMLK